MMLWKTVFLTSKHFLTCGWTLRGSTTFSVMSSYTVFYIFGCGGILITPVFPYSPAMCVTPAAGSRRKTLVYQQSIIWIYICTYPSLSFISTQAYLCLVGKKSLLPASFSKEILVWRYFEDYNCFLLFRWVSREVHHWKERRSAGKTSVSKHNTKLLTSSTPECFSIQALYYFPSFWIYPLQRIESQNFSPFFSTLRKGITVQMFLVFIRKNH